ncbi:HNH endonuclease [Mycobacterium sp. 23]|uniref:HNH endonuclease n=1 Tax=Mycobacterium sp. 23 TaxID=3400424 RepID=UPI003AAAAE0C
MGWGHSRRSTTVRDQHRRQHPPERCAGCGATNVPLIQDHITNLAAGGIDCVPNLQWLCHPCHDVKSAKERRTGYEAKQRYRNQRRHLPQRPHPGD